MVQIHCLHSGNVGWLCPEVSFSFIFIILSSICQQPFEHLYEISWLKQIKREQMKLYMSYCSRALPPNPPRAPHSSAHKAIGLSIQKRIFETDKTGFKFWPSHQLAMWPWASYFGPLGFNFFICVMGKVIPIFQHCHEVENNSVQLNCPDT